MEGATARSGRRPPLPHDADDLRRDPAVHPHRGHPPRRAARDADPRPARRDRRRRAARVDEPRLAARARLDGGRAARRLLPRARPSRRPAARAGRRARRAGGPRRRPPGDRAAPARRERRLPLVRVQHELRARASATSTSRARTSRPACRPRRSCAPPRSASRPSRTPPRTRSSPPISPAASCSGTPRAEAMFGHRAAEALGEPLALLMPERDREAQRAGLARFAATGERARWPRARARGRAGGRHGVPASELSVGSWRHAGSRYLTLVIRDVSDRVRARARAARGRGALRRRLPGRRRRAGARRPGRHAAARQPRAVRPRRAARARARRAARSTSCSIPPSAASTAWRSRPWWPGARSAWRSSAAS